MINKAPKELNETLCTQRKIDRNPVKPKVQPGETTGLEDNVAPADNRARWIIYTNTDHRAKHGQRLPNDNDVL